MVAKLLLCLLCALVMLYYIHITSLEVPQFKVLPPNSNNALDYENGFTNQMHSGLANYLSQRWILAPSLYSLNLDNPAQKDFSQVGQTKFVDDLLAQRRDGFFVECGAASGEELSNTLFFERERGWSGLLIEANPELFQQLLQKNRHAYLVNACLSTSNSTGRLTFYPEDVYGGLDPAHAQPITVQCFPLYPLLLATGHMHIDYFSLDVEGAELPILYNIPFHAVHIDVIGVEYRVNEGKKRRHLNSQKTVEKLIEIREFFRKLGTYKEVGILPWGTHYNPLKQEDHGLDVLFKHI